MKLPAIGAIDARRATGSAALLLSISAAGTGCESMEKNELIGMMGGGLACAAIAKMSGSSDREAVLAAAVCAAAGYAVTKELEDRRRNYADDEQFYAAELERLDMYRHGLQSEIRAARSALATSKARAAELVRTADRTTTERAQLQSLADELDRREIALERELETAEKNRDLQKGLIAHMKENGSQASDEAEAQLRELERSVAELRALVGEHEQQTASLGAYL